MDNVSFRVTCHMSGVTFHTINIIIFLIFFLLHKVAKLVGGGSVINGATPSGFSKYRDNRSVGPTSSQ